jgi:hypothetical protein
MAKRALLASDRVPLLELLDLFEGPRMKPLRAALDVRHIPCRIAVDQFGLGAVAVDLP